ncbi:MAG: PAS domain S-box protein [Spirochaetes bacterium]|nr:PAS domain S-box protein [Spirochaetota bacterium]
MKAKTILNDRDAIVRLLNRHENDLVWSYDLASNEFLCDIDGSGTMRRIPDETAGDSSPRRMIAGETLRLCRELSSRPIPEDLESPFHEEITAEHPLSPVYADVTCLHLPGTDTREGCLVGTSRDITRQKRHEIALMKGEAVYRTLLKTSPDAVLVLDGEGDIIKSNEWASKLLGESRSDLIGCNCMDFIPGADIEDFRILAEQATGRGSFGTREFEMVNAEGRPFTGEIRVSLMDDSMLESETYIAVIRDVTKKKKAEREIIRSGERYMLIIEAMNEGMIIIDKNELFTYLNRSATGILGYTSEELLGVPVSSLLDAENRRVMKRLLAHSRKPKREKRTFDLTVDRKSGGRADLQLSPSGIHGRDGDFLGTLAVVTDVTEMKRAQMERNRLAEELIGIFMNRLSDREKELLSYLSRGYQWPAQKREICKLMDVFPGTLDKFMARIKQKLEIDDIDTIVKLAGEKLP